MINPTGRCVPDSPTTVADRRGWIGVAVAVALMTAAAVVPALTGLRVYNDRFAPLRAFVEPAFGPATITHLSGGAARQWVGAAALAVAVLTATLVVWRGNHVAAHLAWHRLLGLSFVTGLVWLVALGLVRGPDGLRGPLSDPEEYLPTAHGVGSVTAFLHGFVARIDSARGSWPVHVAGHPPGLTLFFVGLDRLELGGALAAGLAVIVLGATTPVAVLITLRCLGAEPAARWVAPLLVLTPAAVWTAVSADTVIAAVVAWGLAVLAVSATGRGASRAVAGIGAGVLLSGSLYLSYGMAVAGLLAAAVLVAARSARVIPWAAVGAAVVVIAFTAGGFAWWEAYPALRARYYDGVASRRPTAYWIWADFAAFCFSAGPVAGAATAAVLTRWRDALREPVVLLPAAGLVCLVAADLSLMSKAEVERIWLPFVPWVLVAGALLSDRWRRRMLVVQAVVAVLIECLLHTYW